MKYYHQHLSQLFHQQHGASYLVLFGYFIGGLFLSPFISYLVALFFSGFDGASANELVVPTVYTSELRTPMLVMQAFSSLCLFLALPYLYLRYYENGSPSALLPTAQVSMPILLVITFCLVISYMPLSAWSINWNNSVVFPEPFEKIARGMEDKLQTITEFMINFDSPFQFAIGLVVVAIIPGIGEEFLFRGVLQNKILSMTQKPHVAIWTSAIIFSFIHFQFYGFVPRMLLGALFGYLYLWSGTLLVPIFAHFINNAYTLIWMHLHQKGIINIEVDKAFGGIWVIASVVLVGCLMYLLKYLHRNQSNIEQTSGLNPLE
jgi:uncharacterized protein